MKGADLIGIIPWEIPGPLWFFKPLLVFSFILHLVFVNWMLGGMFMSVMAEYLGMRSQDERYFRLARALTKWSIVNKSMAIVLGVAPLLLVSVVYTGFVYPSTLLTANAWLALVPWMIVALLACYLYYMTWDRWPGTGRHLAIGAVGAVLLGLVPLLFSTSMVLMLTPDRWWDTRSFFQALFYPTVWPRLLHFYLATVGMAGIFALGLGAMNIRENGTDRSYTDFVVHWGATWALWGTGLQLLAGPLLLFSQPEKVVSAFWGGPYTWLIVVVFALAGSFLVWLQRLRKHRAGASWGRRELLQGTVLIIAVLLLFMATVRHLVREIHLEGYGMSAESRICGEFTPGPDCAALSIESEFPGEVA